MSNKVTVSEVAKLAGVSASTVSMILNGKEKFPEQTCRKVIDACNTLGYTRNDIRLTETLTDKVLLVVVPTLSNFYFVHSTGAMYRRAKELGYSLLVFETMRARSQEARIIQICSSFPFAGAIFCYPPENNMHMKQLEALKPVVHIYDKGIYDQENNIAIDGKRVGMIVGRHLVELGHEKIAYICLDFETKQVMRERRFEGLRAAYREAGLDADKSVILCTPQSEVPQAKTVLDGYELGYVVTKQLIQKRKDITAIVGLNDMVAIGAMDAVKDAGKKVPEDYSICGCDNTITSRYRGVSLTTVESYGVQAGREIVELLVRKIEHSDPMGDEDNAPEGVTQIEYFPKLIVRNSSGPRNKRKKTAVDSEQI